MLGDRTALVLQARRRASSSSGGNLVGSRRPPGGSRHARSRSTDSLADLYLPVTPSELLERVLSEAWLVLGLAFKLWRYLGLGWKWLWNVWRLVLYALLLLPGFVQMVHYYFTSPEVQRSLPYGRKPRQRLDLYTPKGRHRSPAAAAGAAAVRAWPAQGGAAADADGSSSSDGGGGGRPLLPVVIFVTGGAWTIGYKAWGALLARRLCGAGVMVACLDYRNFPQGSAADMLEDVNTGIAWVLRKAERHGGDPDATFLVGQSAGGQLAMLAALTQAAQAASGQAAWGGAPVWHPRSLAGYVGVSGACDLEGLADHLHKRGLYRNLLDSIMRVDGQVSYEALSPLHAARCAGPAAGAFMPRVLLLHGTADKTVPAASSLLMHDALLAAGVDSSLHLLPGKTHTDLLLEDGFAGGRDVLTDSVLECITGVPQASDYPCMCPRILVRLASRVCPF